MNVLAMKVARRRIAAFRWTAGLSVALVLWAAATAPRAADEAEPPALVVFAATGGAAAAANVPPLTGDGEATLRSLREDPNVSDLRIGQSAPDAVLRAAAFSLALSPAPGDTVRFLGIERTDHPNGMVSLEAWDTADREASIVIDGQDVLGSMHDGEGNSWRMTPLGGGRTAVYRYDTSRLRMHPPGWDPAAIPDMDAAPREHVPENVPEHVPEHAPENATGADTGEIIDVMVIYTRAARIKTGNIDSFIRTAFDHAHRHYGNSNIPFRLRLVHAEETAYTEAGDIANDLLAIAQPYDGPMDDVHALRDRYGADLVHLFISGTTPSGGGAVTCGVAFFAHRPDLENRAFGVTAVECENSGQSTFTHEIGHNQGAHHDVANLGRTLPPFPYGLGHCHPVRRWATVMAYAGLNNNCSGYIPYFSSSSRTYQGDPTGNAHMDNRRVLMETARVVANHRQATDPPAPSHTLPLVTAASNTRLAGFIRIINHSNHAGTVDILAFDDDGRRSGPVSLSLEAATAAHLTSADLENGNASKGLSAGIGQGTGNWRLELTSDLNVEPLAYIRTPDGFLTGMHEMAAETAEGSNRYYVPFFNPVSNTDKVSLLRLINPGDATAGIEITGVDDAGEGGPSGGVRLSLGAGAARMLSVRELEEGGSGLSGRLGDGSGKWRLSVSSDRPLRVMSLLQLETGQGRYLANVSRGQAGISVGPPPPPADGPDLVVRSPSVSDNSLSAGQSFTLRATVRNQGEGRSAATTLRWYLSPDATISTGDTRVGTDDGVGALSASGASSESIESIDLTAPLSAGVYYYGACVGAVPGESDTGNNCSSGVRVTVTGADRRASYCNADSSYRGAIASGWTGSRCMDGFGWGVSLNYRDRNAAITRAESVCRSLGLDSCAHNVVFSRCGALAYGAGIGCNLYGGSGTTRAEAEQQALSQCRDDYDNCQIPTGVSANTRAAPRAEAQSGGYTMDSPPGASNPGPRLVPDR